jgi:hypothetical protein
MRDLPAHFAQVLALSILGVERNAAVVLRERMIQPGTTAAQLDLLSVAYGAVLDHDAALFAMACDPTLDAATIDALPGRKAEVMDGVNDLFFQTLDTVRIAA